MNIVNWSNQVILWTAIDDVLLLAIVWLPHRHISHLQCNSLYGGDSGPMVENQAQYNRTKMVRSDIAHQKWKETKFMVQTTEWSLVQH